MPDDLPQLLERERELLPLLQRLGASEDDLKVLRGDEQLLEILAAEKPSSKEELERVMKWHRERLQRVVEQLPR